MENECAIAHIVFWHKNNECVNTVKSISMWYIVRFTLYTLRYSSFYK